MDLVGWRAPWELRAGIRAGSCAAPTELARQDKARLESRALPCQGLA